LNSAEVRVEGYTSKMRNWSKEPLIHFFVLGLVVFGLHAVLEQEPEPADDPYLVEVSSAELEWLRTMWKKRMNREPTVQELRSQVNQVVRETILEREAVQMGLDKDDVVLRRRLAQKMEFLFKDLSSLAQPSEADLREYLEQNRGQYETPMQVTFTQVFFNADKRGVEGAEQAVKAFLESLEARSGTPSAAHKLGDASMLPPQCRKCDEREIQGRFGTAFAGRVKTLSPGSWHGPVKSGYGLHAVYVQERSEPRLPGFDEIRARIEADWISERQRANTQKAYQELRSQYRVLLEGLPYDIDMDLSSDAT
jgi:peptidyl-prolyl cis-trans isomerase C